MEKSLTVLEFYSGIGGTHYALDQSDIKYKVIGAFDINTTANIVYKHNFPQTNLCQKNIDGFTVEYLDKFNADMWTMSPPCQPYTRQGKQLASNDNRSKSFLNLLRILEEMKFPPKYIFLENVKGFESSDTRKLFMNSLDSRNYLYQEFMICPSDLGIPNSRTRYYMVAKHEETFQYIPLPSPLMITTDSCVENCPCNSESICFQKALNTLSQNCVPQQVSDFVDCEDDSSYLLPEELLTRYHSILDIVNPESFKSCCFTKAYGKYVEGTGSVFTRSSNKEINQTYKEVDSVDILKEKYTLLSKLEMRYFTPDEIARLMFFPHSFEFPDLITLKQRYRLLGNSVNVFVISCLMKWFLF